MGRLFLSRADVAALTLLALLLASCDRSGNTVVDQPPPDEAKARHLTADYFVPDPAHVEDYFHDMDTISVPESEDAYPDQLLDLAKPANPGGDPRPKRRVGPPQLTKSEQLGRNTWMIWCGGNERFWDWLSCNSHGFLDFVKLLDSHNRAARWEAAGMVNEPGMIPATAPGPFGLWLDQPTDPKVREYREKYLERMFDEFEKYGGYKKYGKTDKPYAEYPPGIPPAEIYGLSSGVIGLRLFPNPDFHGAARKRWDAKRFYDPNDRDYWNDPALVRPFRVGMSCAFCHTSAHPLNPPANPANPRWENLSGNIGSQYLRMRSVFGNMLTDDNFVYHVLDSQPPGTIDTSLVATDYINNTNTMNAIFGVPQRVGRSFSNPRETLSATAATMPSVWTDAELKSLPPAYAAKFPRNQLMASNGNPRWVPRILFDGADSIGAWGALARVYLNIGTYSEQWVRLHEPLLGFLPPEAGHGRKGVLQLPFKINDCESQSVYWQATQKRVPALRDYFLRITPTMPLMDANARGAVPAQRIRSELLKHGRDVFARNCIVCHSSIQPETDSDVFLDPTERTGFDVRHAEIKQARIAKIREWETFTADGASQSWDHEPGQWLEDPRYKAWASEVIEKPGFWKQNFLSSDFRIPVNYVGTNSGRAMATNGMGGHMWEDFTSASYRALPSVGPIPYFNPFTGRDETYEPRQRVIEGPPKGGGPGYYRPASLMSVWATAPLLHNNSLGKFNHDPSVKGRLEAFDDAIHKLLWPAKRLESSDYASAEQLKRDHGLIWRTPKETYLRIRAKDVPYYLRRLPLPRFVFAWSEGLYGMGRWRAVPTLVLLGVAWLAFSLARGRSWKSAGLRAGGFVAIALGLLIGFVAFLSTGGLGDIRLGPIPKGTPVNLLANINPDADAGKVRDALRATVDGLSKIDARQLDDKERERVLREEIAPKLMDVSKCPDFVMDKGHYFPWFNQMTDQDKEALIELLKTF